MIFFNSENSIRDVRPFCCALFCHSSVVKHTSSLLHLAKSLLDLTDYWIPPPKLNGWIFTACDSVFFVSYFMYIVRQHVTKK